MWTELAARPIEAASVGLVATTLLVVAAVAVRAPLPAETEETHPDTGAVATATTAEAPVASAEATAPADPARVPPAVGALPGVGAPPGVGALPGVGPLPTSESREVWARLSKEYLTGRYADAVASLDKLFTLDPRAADDREVRNIVIDLTMRVMMMEGPEPEHLCTLITTRTGTTGADILYELLTTKGGSRAAKRAEQLLRSDEVRASGTPGLRIAYDLRAAACADKPALFARATTDGDGRTLGQLQLLNQECGRRSAGCCLPKDPALKQAIESLKTRLR